MDVLEGYRTGDRRVDPAIQLHGVSKAFGSTSAIDRLDVLVPDYGLHGFIGPNGARKTTVLRS